jgi:hypothetical protein
MPPFTDGLNRKQLRGFHHKVTGRERDAGSVFSALTRRENRKARFLSRLRGLSVLRPLFIPDQGTPDTHSQPRRLITEQVFTSDIHVLRKLYYVN